MDGAGASGQAGVGPTVENALADDWVVISAYGRIGERGGFLAAIKSGQFTRKTMDVSERQTDVLIWSDGAWKSVLLHETLIHK